MTKERITIFNKTNGKCAYCGCNLPKRWHVDHVMPVRRDSGNGNTMDNPENDVIENKIASCPPCNISKSTMSIETYRSEIYKTLERLREFNPTYRRALRYNLVKENNDDIVFYFETLNK